MKSCRKSYKKRAAEQLICWISSNFLIHKRRDQSSPVDETSVIPGSRERAQPDPPFN